MRYFARDQRLLSVACSALFAIAWFSGAEMMGAAAVSFLNGILIE